MKQIELLCSKRLDQRRFTVAVVTNPMLHNDYSHAAAIFKLRRSQTVVHVYSFGFAIDQARAKALARSYLIDQDSFLEVFTHAKERAGQEEKTG